jgi:hypothetical protein
MIFLAIILDFNQIKLIFMSLKIKTRIINKKKSFSPTSLGFKLEFN